MAIFFWKLSISKENTTLQTAKWPCWKSGRPGPYCWLVSGSSIILMEDERCKKWVLTGLKLVTVVKLYFFFLFISSHVAPRQLLESTRLHVILLFPWESWEDSFFSIKLIFSLISGWTIEVVKFSLSFVGFEGLKLKKKIPKRVFT